MASSYRDLQVTTCKFYDLVQFHIAHLFEIQSKYELAKEAYQAIIAAPGMPPHIQSVAWRQLGICYLLSFIAL